MSAHIVITCDRPMEGGTCAASVTGPLPLERAVVAASRSGWLVGPMSGVALCPVHRGGGA